ncbi:unnamed protein product [Closterium sp. NIES-53]
MYLMTCTLPVLVYPLSLLACYVALGRHRKVHWDAAKRVLRFVHSSCEAEIYAGAMAAPELRWLTYLLTDLGEQPRSPPVLYVDKKAMIALCQEHRLEHRTKHIALRYFLARELQQRGQLRLAYVATRANTADVFTKALPPGDPQRFVTVLGLLALFCLTGLNTRTRREAIAAQHTGQPGAGQLREQGRQQQGAASGLQVAVRRLQEGRLAGLGAVGGPRGSGRVARGGARGCRGCERDARGGDQGSRGGGQAARGGARGCRGG